MAKKLYTEEDLVNATGKARLAQRDSEPSHLAGAASYKEIGGTKGVDAEPNTAKVDGASDMGTDTSIPHSVPGEKTHLGRITGSPEAKEADDVAVTFDGDEQGTDDIDRALDSFEDVKPIDIDVKLDSDGGDEKDKKDDDGDKKEPFGKMNSKKDDDGEKKDNPFVKKESRTRRGRRLTEEPFPDDPGASERGDAAGAIKKNETEPESAINSGPNTVKEDDEDPTDEGGEKDENPFAKDEVDEDLEPYQAGELDKVEANADEPDAAMNKKVEESLTVRIKLPKTELFESAGVSKRDQKRIGVVMEAVLKDLTKQIAPQVHKHYRKLHEQKIKSYNALLANQIDSYLNYVVEEWVKTNKVAVRQTLRSQLSEEFLGGLQRLFAEHYIDVPSNKVDVVKQLSRQVSALKTSLSEQTAQKIKLRKLAEAANKARIVLDFARKNNLSEAQTTKLAKLAENTQYVTGKDFREKLGMLSESYFPGKDATKGEKKLTGQTWTEEVAPEAVGKKTKASGGDDLVNAVLDASKRLNDQTAW